MSSFNAIALTRNLAWLAVVLLGAAAVAQELRVEADSSAIRAEAVPIQPPPRDPVGAWQVARQQVPQGDLVRRLALANHGLFVFFGPDGGDQIMASFVGWSDSGYRLDRLEPAESRDSSICKAPGIAPERVESAIQALLIEGTYLRYRPQLDSLILECHEDRLFWSLLPIPPEGFQAGVAVTTYSIPLRSAEGN
ncbi:MAG: hypothetical protein KDI71_04855 [Xanthomonadales bacterium]|nr:hypothetical protein [Xanthomonadales bacterium]